MIKDKELDLLIDLAKLIKKHGPESFDTLSEVLSSEENIRKLIILLKDVAYVAKKAKKTPRRTNTKKKISQGSDHEISNSYDEDRSLDAWSKIILNGKSKK